MKRKVALRWVAIWKEGPQPGEAKQEGAEVKEKNGIVVKWTDDHALVVDQDTGLLRKVMFSPRETVAFALTHVTEDDLSGKYFQQVDPFFDGDEE